eukprot:611434-Prymnesium_polylepis.1
MTRKGRLGRKSVDSARRLSETCYRVYVELVDESLIVGSEMRQHALAHGITKEVLLDRANRTSTASRRRD